MVVLDRTVRVLCGSVGVLMAFDGNETLLADDDA